MDCTRLEIDEDIFKKTLLLNSKPDEELQTLFPASKYKVASAVIKPKPGICVKTKDYKSDKKVFINVCTSEEVPAPEDISTEELISILESDEPSDFKIPMSIGQPHEEKDKAGNSCTSYDIVVNPIFYNKMMDDPLFHNFFMIVTIEGLDDKYSVSLDKNSWTVLKNKKYHGSIPEQTVCTPLPKVQELSGTRHWNPEDFETAASAAPPPPGIKKETTPLISEIKTRKLNDVEANKKLKPKAIIQKVFQNSSPYLKAELELPDTVVGSDIKVSVGEDRIIAETSKYFLDVFVPYNLDGNKSQAFFITSSRILIILMPVAFSQEKSLQ